MAVGDSRLKPVGVHYTPACIVDYMVRETLGTADSESTVLDPSCGDGAFLTAAFERLCQGHPRGKQPAERRRIASGQIFGVDVDAGAVQAARLRLARMALGERAADSDIAEFADQLEGNVKVGNAVLGPELRAKTPPEVTAQIDDGFDWRREFPAVFACKDAREDGFDLILGNPPYRRERGFQAELAQIAATPFGERWHAARMDLWYYFLHRGLEVLRPGGRLSFIVSAYWLAGRGAEKLIGELRQHVQIEEIFSLGRLPVFPRVAGQHLMLRIAKQTPRAPSCIRQAREDEPLELQLIEPPAAWFKTAEQLFVGGQVDLAPPADRVLARLAELPLLGTLGRVRQGIAENPATINRKTNERHGNRWTIGEGVFSLGPQEVQALDLSPDEAGLLRPYHDFADIGRHRLAAPSRTLIYSTPKTWPELSQRLRLAAHLERFRPVLEARREVQRGTIGWWHLHWPRAESLWQSGKILVPQFGSRPAFVAAPGPAYVPFSVNVFVPHTMPHDWELDYLAGVLGSRLLWTWFKHHAKLRGSGLEINGHVLARAPIRPLATLSLGELQQARRIAELARALRSGELASEPGEFEIDELTCSLFEIHPQD